jgi:hypothetical protein
MLCSWDLSQCGSCCEFVMKFLSSVSPGMKGRSCAEPAVSRITVLEVQNLSAVALGLGEPLVDTEDC